MKPLRRLRHFLSNPVPPWWASAALWGWPIVFAAAFLWTSVPTPDDGPWLTTLTILRITTLSLTIISILVAYLRRETQFTCYRIISQAADGICPHCSYNAKGLHICPECGTDIQSLAQQAARLVNLKREAPPNP